VHVQDGHSNAPAFCKFAIFYEGSRKRDAVSIGITYNGYL
jgi:hypothetical protein